MGVGALWGLGLCFSLQQGRAEHNQSAGVTSLGVASSYSPALGDLVLMRPQNLLVKRHEGFGLVRMGPYFRSV